MNIYYDKAFYLIGGPNGSGKTTIAHELIDDNPNIAFLNSDEIMRANNVSQECAGRMLLSKMDDLFSAHASFAFETTLSGKLHNKFIKRARGDGYKIVFLYVYLASVEENIARVRQRVALGGHDVPENIIRRRYKKSLLNFEPVTKQSDQWELYYNGNTSYELLAHGMGEKIDVINNPMYRNFLERRANALSERLLELGQRATERARIIAMNSGLQLPAMAH